MFIHEDLNIKNLIKIDENKYFIQGIMKTDEMDFSLIVDNGVAMSPIKTIASISKKLYEFFSVLNLNSSDIKITFESGGNQFKILEANDQDLHSIVNASNIAYEITNIVSNFGSIEVYGWAFSNGNTFIDLKIINSETEDEQDCSIRRTIYQKLQDCKATNNIFSGFICTFLKEDGKEYQLVFNNGSQSVCVSLSSFFQDNNKKRVSLSTFVNKVNSRNVKKAFAYLKENGIKELINKVKYGITNEVDYNAWFLRNRVTNEELEEQRKYVFSYSPKISILVPTFNTPIDLLKEMIESVRGQSYSNWELCIADGSDSEETKKVIQEYVDLDSRIKVVWLEKNNGISGNTNKALELTTGEYTALFDHDDALEPDALFEVVKCLQNVKYDVIYTDEDKLNGETLRYEDPNMKSDYNVDLLLSHNYITHFFVTKTTIIKGVEGFDSQYDGAQDYDVIFKCIEQARNIHHIPKVLYHWRMTQGSTALDPESKMYAYVAGQNAIQAHLDRIGVKAKAEMMGKPFWGLNHVKYYLQDRPLVSIIIPNYEHTDVLKTCIDSLFEVNRYENMEVIIVENNSVNQETFDYYKQIQGEHENVHVVKWEGKEFNFSAINNFGVKHSNGEYLLFLNNDTQMIKEDALEEMLGLCMRDDVGVVGAKLLYGDNTIQHAGIVLGYQGYAVHVFNSLNGCKDGGFMMRPFVNCDYSAVTAACMMTKRSLFDEVNGFDEQFKVSCNDIDYCLKIREKNKLVVYNAFSLWHHFESKSRGYEADLSKVKRFDQEITNWQNKWEKVLKNGDKFYNSNFKLEDRPFKLR